MTLPVPLVFALVLKLLFADEAGQKAYKFPVFRFGFLEYLIRMSSITLLLLVGSQPVFG
jgi:hypothetical protein